MSASFEPLAYLKLQLQIFEIPVQLLTSSEQTGWQPLILRTRDCWLQGTNPFSVCEQKQDSLCHLHKTDISQRMCNSEVSYLLIQDTLFPGHRVLSEKP